jgi:8-oxo-dGTP pyrophosphatase MutT (NUDIX family)
MPNAIAYAAGVVIKSTRGRVLMLRRVDTGEWAWPAGGIKPGEDAEACAIRETFEETGHHLGFVDRLLMHRVKDDGDGVVDFSTYIREGVEEFVPKLNHEHSEWGWFGTRTAFEEAKLNRNDALVAPAPAGQ